MSDPRNEFDEEPADFDHADEAADEASLQRGLADAEAGRFISHDAMKRWLRSWGTGDPVPPPKCGE